MKKCGKRPTELSGKRQKFSIFVYGTAGCGGFTLHCAQKPKNQKNLMSNT